MVLQRDRRTYPLNHQLKFVIALINFTKWGFQIQMASKQEQILLYALIIQIIDSMQGWERNFLVTRFEAASDIN